MPSVFLVSDTHFGHKGVCHFTRNDGVTKLRPFDTPEEMDEFMVEAWNARVRPNDKVYHLGDVVINRKALKIMSRLNGDKVLIRGNHDIFRDDEYREYFRELRAYHVMNGMILSHIPIHEESLGRFGVNIHGHLHANRVMKDGVVETFKKSNKENNIEHHNNFPYQDQNKNNPQDTLDFPSKRVK